MVDINQHQTRPSAQASITNDRAQKNLANAISQPQMAHGGTQGTTATISADNRSPSIDDEITTAIGGKSSNIQHQASIEPITSSAQEIKLTVADPAQRRGYDQIKTVEVQNSSVDTGIPARDGNFRGVIRGQRMTSNVLGQKKHTQPVLSNADLSAVTTNQQASSKELNQQRKQSTQNVQHPFFNNGNVVPRSDLPANLVVQGKMSSSGLQMHRETKTSFETLKNSQSYKEGFDKEDKVQLAQQVEIANQLNNSDLFYTFSKIEQQQKQQQQQVKAEISQEELKTIQVINMNQSPEVSLRNVIQEQSDTKEIDEERKQILGEINDYSSMVEDSQMQIANVSDLSVSSAHLLTPLRASTMPDVTLSSKNSTPQQADKKDYTPIKQSNLDRISKVQVSTNLQQRSATRRPVHANSSTSLKRFNKDIEQALGQDNSQTKLNQRKSQVRILPKIPILNIVLNSEQKQIDENQTAAFTMDKKKLQAVLMANQNHSQPREHLQQEYKVQQQQEFTNDEMFDSAQALAKASSNLLAKSSMVPAKPKDYNLTTERQQRFKYQNKRYNWESSSKQHILSDSINTNRGNVRGSQSMTEFQDVQKQRIQSLTSRFRSNQTADSTGQNIKQSQNQYGSRSELMNFIKNGRAERKEYNSLSQRTFAKQKLPQIIPDRSNFESTEQSINSQTAVNQEELKGFQVFDPLQAVRNRNNMNMLESALKGPVMKKLKQNISDYKRHKLGFEQTTAQHSSAASEAFKNLQLEQQIGLQSMEGNQQQQQQRMIPTKKSQYQSQQKQIKSPIAEDSLTTETQESFISEQRSKRKHSVQPSQKKQANNKQRHHTQFDLPPDSQQIDMGSIQLKTEPSELRNVPQTRYQSSLGHHSETNQQQSFGFHRSKVNLLDKQMKGNDLANHLLGDPNWKPQNFQHYQFMNQPESDLKLASMVISQSRANLRASADDGKSQPFNSKRTSENYIKSNRQSIQDAHFGQDRVRLYCADQMPSKQEIDDEHRLKFLNQINQELGNSTSIKNLKAIEKTNPNLAHSQKDQDQIDQTIEKMSFRKPKYDEKINKSDQVFEQDQEELETLLIQKRILKEYCSSVAEINKKHHQESYENVKRHHDKINAIVRQDEEKKALREQQQLEMKLREEKKRRKNIKRRHVQAAKSALEKYREAKAIARMQREYFDRYGKHLDRQQTQALAEDDSSMQLSGVEFKDPFEMMLDRVNKKVKQHRLKKKTARIVEFRKELIEEFEQILRDEAQEVEDQKAIEPENLSEDGLNKIMTGRLERKLDDIFNRTDFFYKYQQMLESNQEKFYESKINQNFAKERREMVENKKKQQLKELIPNLLLSSQKSESNQTASEKDQPQLALNKIKSTLKGQLQVQISKNLSSQHNESFDIIEQSAEEFDESMSLSDDGTDSLIASLEDDSEEEKQIYIPKKKTSMPPTTQTEGSGSMTNFENMIRRSVKLLHYEQDFNASTMSEISVQIAKDMEKQIEEYDQKIQKLMSKQLFKKAQFGLHFKLQERNFHDEKVGSEEGKGSIGQAVRKFFLLQEQQQIIEKATANVMLESQNQLSLITKALTQSQTIGIQIDNTEAIKQQRIDKAIAKLQAERQQSLIQKKEQGIFRNNESEQQIRRRVEQMLQQNIGNQKNHLPQEQSQLIKSSKKALKVSAQRKFVDQVIQRGRVPLPLFNKIHEKFLFLQDYHIGPMIFNTFAEQLPAFIPNSLNQLVLQNNKIQNEGTALLFNTLNEIPCGPQVIGIIHNEIGPEAIGAISSFLEGDNCEKLTQFIIQDPIFPKSKHLMGLDLFTQGIVERGRYIHTLTELCLANCSLNQDEVLRIAEFCTIVQSLRNLNISNNGLTVTDFIAMFEILHPLAYHISYMNLSWNSMSDVNETEKVQTEFRKKFADFLRHSRTLQHIDLCGMNFSKEALEYVTLFGLRKSKTLLAAHMSGNFETPQQLDQFREWMKVYRVDRKITEGSSNLTPIEKKKIDLEAGVAQAQEVKYKPRLNNKSFVHNYRPNQHQIIKQKLNEQYIDTTNEYNIKRQEETKNSQKLAKVMRKGGLETNYTDRVVFQRFLGHYEIINGYRWHEVDESNCFLCNNWSYCMFVHDRQLAQNDDVFYSFDSSEINNARPQTTLTSTYISIDSIEQVLPLIPVQDFISRLQANKHSGGVQRNIKDHQIEQEAAETRQKTEVYDSRKTKLVRMQKQKSLIKGGPGMKEKSLQWHNLLHKFIKPVINGIEPQGILQHGNFEKICRQSCQNESLMVCAAYLPPKVTTIIIQDQMQQQAQVQFCQIFPQTFAKAPRKNTRKVQEIRKFDKNNSCFREFKGENLDLYRKQLTYDTSMYKVSRFVKEQDQLSQIFSIFLKFYKPLRDQFLSQICKMNSYPQIDWIEFTNYCQTWNLLDENLKMSDTDRIFIATIVDLDNQKEEGSRSLCRYEFFEILVRLAKTKFLEPKKVNTISEALEKMIVGFILPNAHMRIESTEWRKTFLYTLEVDDLLKSNMDNIKRVFYRIKRKKENFLQRVDVIEYFGELPLEVTQDTYTLAFAFSKIQFIEEIPNRENYDRLYFVEFLEFLGRLAFLAWDENPGEPLDIKLWHLLHIVFGTFDEEVKDALFEDDIDSESDYEDEIATEILMQNHPKDLYAGFGRQQEKTEQNYFEKDQESHKGAHYRANPYARIPAGAK